MRMDIVHGPVRTGIHENIARSLVPSVPKHDEPARRKLLDDALRFDRCQAVIRFKSLRPKQPQDFRAGRPGCPFPCTDATECRSSLQRIAEVARLALMQAQ